MGRVIRLAAMIVAMAAGLSMPAAGQGLALGTWTGSVRIPPPRNPNPRPATLTVKKVPDSHWRWRGGPKDILSVSFATPRLGGAAEATDVELTDSRLSFSFSVNEEPARCDLQRDGVVFEGECQGSGFRLLIALTPPEPDTGPAK